MNSSAYVEWMRQDDANRIGICDEEWDARSLCPETNGNETQV